MNNYQVRLKYHLPDSDGRCVHECIAIDVDDKESLCVIMEKIEKKYLGYVHKKTIAVVEIKISSSLE